MRIRGGQSNRIDHYKKQYDVGIIIGKFLPMHKGHQYLIDFASQMSEHLFVVVCDHYDDPIHAIHRKDWIEETQIVIPKILKAGMPQQPSEDPDFWNIWSKALNDLLHINLYKDKKKVALFSSEDYGWRLAKELGIEHVPVNPDRTIVPISGDHIRTFPFGNWDHIVERAREDLVIRVVIGGPESTGKTILGKLLADHYKTVYVPEYGRDYFEMRRNFVQRHKTYNCTLDDLEHIYRGHIASTNAAARIAPKPIMFIDTDLFCTQLYSQLYFGTVNKTLFNIAPTYIADLVLVCKPNVPHVQDHLRDLKDSRDQFYDQYTDLLEEHGYNWQAIDCDSFPARTDQAIHYVEQLIEKYKKVWFNRSTIERNVVKVSEPLQ